MRPMLICLALTVSLCSVLVAAPVGWRGNGTGKYLDATPPTEWAADKNVVWSTPLPSRSNSTPVIVGDRIIFCAEPTLVMCASASTGQILWQSSCAFEDLAPDQADKMKADNARAGQLRGDIGKLWRTANDLKKQVQDKPEDQGLKDQLAAAQQKAQDLTKELEPLTKTWYAMPGTHPENGNTSYTPVSDGHHVWVMFNTGLVACYGLDGKRIWWKVVEKLFHDWGGCCSPVLVGNKLIVHPTKMFALDKDTGEQIWQQDLQWGWGTPAVASIGGTDVIITAKGAFVRAEDGKVLARVPVDLTYDGPVIEGGVVYYIQNGGKAVKLPAAVENDQLNVQVLWDTAPRNDRYYSSPIIHEGIIYDITQAAVFSAIDAETGKVIYEQTLDLHKGTCYPSVTFAGGLLFVSSDSGTTAIVKPGREYQQVAMNTLENFRASPVFVGNRMYVRGFGKLWCIDTE